MSIDRGMDKEVVVHIHNGILLSHKRNTFESVLIRWMNLEPIIHSEVIISHWSEWPSSKSLQTINAGEGVEKREPSCTVGGNVILYNHYGKQYEVSLKH